MRLSRNTTCVKILFICCLVGSSWSRQAALVVPRHPLLTSCSHQRSHHTTSLASHHHNQVNLLANKNRILSTIDSLIDQQEQVKCSHHHQQQQQQQQHYGQRQQQQQQQQQRTSMGLLGTPIMPSTAESPNNDIYSNYHIPLDGPGPGTTLIPQKAPLTNSAWITKHRLKEHMSVHVGRAVDDVEVANLRLSVFSDYTVDEIAEWVYRSSNIIAQRRLKGATTINASLNYINERQGNEVESWIVGSIECSTHEFIGTELGMLRPPGSILYVTEVAVSPKLRRSGTATLLLQALDNLAHMRYVETIYLHVDVKNIPAINLYRRAGFEVLDSHNNPMYAEFTRRLNLHDGATRGRNHYLMHKKVSRKQTWLRSHNDTSSSRRRMENDIPSSSSSRRRGKIGFEMWDPY